MLLTDKEIFDITGARNKEAQKRILSQNNIRFIVRTDGKPATTWEAVNSVLINKTLPRQIIGPDLEFLTK
jgi:Domain of unknown function (DUF4224)